MAGIAQNEENRFFFIIAALIRNENFKERREKDRKIY